MFEIDKIETIKTTSPCLSNYTLFPQNKSISQQDEFVVNRKMVALADDLHAGILLTKIIDLFAKKDCVSYGDKRWVTRPRTEWYKDICLTPRQIDRALGILKKELILTKKVHLGGQVRVLLRLSNVIFDKNSKVINL